MMPPTRAAWYAACLLVWNAAYINLSLRDGDWEPEA